MKSYKRYFALLTVLCLCLSTLWNTGVASAAEKLGKKDFVFTGSQFDGKYDFLQFLEDESYIGENGWALSIYYYNKDTDKSKKGCIKTSRDIVLGSTLKSVKAEYGDAKAKTTKDSIYEAVTEQADDKALKSTMKATKNYIDYNYTFVDSAKYKNKVILRFYFDKDNKVSMICMINNLKFISF